MSLIICNMLENLVSILEADKVLKDNMDVYKEEIIGIKNSLTKFSGSTAEKYRENCDVFVGTTGDAGKIPRYLYKLESYNTIMEELTKDTSKLVDRCRYFGQTLLDDNHKTDYSDGLKYGHHVFYDEYIDTIKSDCDKCLEYDADELEHVKKADSWLSGETFPDGYSNPIDGIKDTMSTYIEEQDRIENFKFSINAYALFSKALSDYVKEKFTAMSDSDFQNFPKPSGMGATDSIKEKLRSNYEDVKLYSAYLQGEEGLAKLQEDCDKYNSADDAEKERIGKKIATMFGYCASQTNGCFEQSQAQRSLDGLGIITAWAMTTPNGKGHIETDSSKLDVLDSNISGDNTTAKAIIQELRNCDIDAFDGKISNVTYSFDKAGITAKVEVQSNGKGVFKKEYVAIFYTSQERSEDYIDYKQKLDPSYADHLMNDLGYSKEQLAKYLTDAQNHYDMEQLDNLVNSNGDYSNTFKTDVSQLSNECGDDLNGFAFSLMSNNDGIPRSEEELTKFTCAVLNASYDSYGVAKTEDLLKLLSTRAGVYNDACIRGYYCGEGTYETLKDDLNLSNGMYNYWAYLGGYYEYLQDHEMSVFSNGQNHIQLSITPIIDEDGNVQKLYSDITGNFGFCVDQTIIGSVDSSNLQVTSFNSNGGYFIKGDPAIVGAFTGDEAQRKWGTNYMTKIMKDVEEAERNLTIDSAIDMVSTFSPEMGKALEIAKTMAESDFASMLKKGEGLSEDMIGKFIDDPFVINELEANGYDMDTINRLIDEGKIVFSLGSVVSDYVTDYAIEENKLKDASELVKTLMSTDTIYSYNNGSGTIKLSNPESIDFVKQWDQYGCGYFVSEPEHYREIVFPDSNSDKLSYEVVKQLGVSYGIIVNGGENIKAWDEHRYNQVLDQIVKKTNYSEDQIVRAFTIVLDGKQVVPEKSEEWGSVRDVPPDLCVACMNALDNSELNIDEENNGFSDQLKGRMQSDKSDSE
ncbi:hypothetical protein [Butyrivibrio sp. XBB1001]|uniref:hypothetical protein n=1 Tax=Butyrivibrio sp. XBB1001 TaxID=1280682 RepID=UPI0003F6BC1F|nr:hypothetical protein [Butyrivibrio sp. XBB1001]